MAPQGRLLLACAVGNHAIRHSAGAAKTCLPLDCGEGNPMASYRLLTAIDNWILVAA